MLWPLLLMIFASTLFFGAMLVQRVRAEILDRERNSRWVRDMVSGDDPQGAGPNLVTETGGA
jgi:heme exporter protein C